MGHKKDPIIDNPIKLNKYDELENSNSLDSHIGDPNNIDREYNSIQEVIEKENPYKENPYQEIAENPYATLTPILGETNHLYSNMYDKLNKQKITEPVYEDPDKLSKEIKEAPEAPSITSLHELINHQKPKPNR